MRRLLALLAALLLAGTAHAQTPPLRQVATNTLIPFTTAPSYLQMDTRVSHIAKQALTSLSLVMPNFYVNQATGELGNGGTASVTASIEYPAGTVTLVTFSGRLIGSIPSGGMLVSDAMPLKVAIPVGAKFWVTSWYSNPSGIIFSLYTVAQPFGINDLATSLGVTTPDTTGIGGTAGLVSGQYAYGPVAIIAPSTQPAACLLGDSRVQGVYDVRNDFSADGGELARWVGRNTAYLVMAAPGDTGAGTLAGTGNRRALGQYCSGVLSEYDINDAIHGATVAQMVAARTALAALFPGLPVYGVTLAPYTTSTDNWATTANQTVSGIESVRQAFNAAVRAGIPGEAGVIDIDQAIDPGATGKWPANGTAQAYTPDGLHETTLSAVTEQRSGIWQGLRLP